jgi:hypothetical protein
MPQTCTAEFHVVLRFFRGGNHTTTHAALVAVKCGDLWGFHTPAAEQPAVAAYTTFS